MAEKKSEAESKALEDAAVEKAEIE